MSSNAEPVGETGQSDSTSTLFQYPSNLSHIFDSLQDFLVNNHIVLTGAHTIKLRAADEEAILAGTFVVEVEVMPLRPLTLQSPNEMIDSTTGQIGSLGPTTGVIDNDVGMIDASAQQPVIRPDWLAFLEAELPRWALWGLWGGAADVTPPADGGGHEYRNLQLAYSAVCFLEKRVDYDSIRCRIALVELHREYERACANRQEIEQRRRIGWGVSSSTIDYILRNTHSDWSLLNESQRKSRRAQFHDRKRYGKRWAVLTDGLGTGIVLLSSTHLAKAVHNTSFTSEMLGQFVQLTRGDATTMRVLEQVREVADQLWLGQPCGSHNANALLNALKMGSGGDYQVLE
ncbi:hypothetical protein MY11210_005638 [Beauveria gryllotalpidicola]